MRRTGQPRWRGLFGPALLVLLATACGGQNGAMQAARQSDTKTLRNELLGARAQGRLNRSLTQEIARAMLEGELERSHNLSGVAFVQSLSPCSRELSGALEDRSQRRDDVGGEALLLLVESGREGKRARSHEGDEIPSYRAAFARSLTKPEDAERRSHLYADPDQRVRRAALDAALGSASSTELDALKETARVDPDPLCQSKALRLIGTIDDERSLSLLLERYTPAKERERLSVIEGLRQQAQASPVARDELFYIASSAEGIVRLTAAVFLLRSSIQPPLPAERQEVLTNFVSEFARTGTLTEQILALGSLTPDTRETRQLLTAAATSPQKDLRVAALIALLEDEKERTRAQRELLALAAEPSTPGRAARDALARRGDTRVLPFALRDTKDPDPRVRVQAADALLALTRWDHAGTLLADPDHGTRLELACTMLAHN